MNRIKAEKLIKRKATRLKPCPFCRSIPVVEARCDRDYSAHGSYGHYAIRRKCCNATQGGQTELFFCNNWSKPNFKLWWKIFSRLVDDWNKRV